MQRLDKLINALLGDHRLAPRDCGVGHGNRVDLAGGTPAPPLTVDQGLDPVEAYVQQGVGSRMGRREVDAELLRRGRATQPDEHLKSGVTGHVLCVVGSRCGNPGRFAGIDAEALCNGKQLAAHGENTCVAAQGQRAKGYHLHRITAQEASSVPLPKRRTIFEAIAGAGSKVRLGYSLLLKRPGTPSENKRITSVGCSTKEIGVCDRMRQPSTPSLNSMVLATLPNKRHRTLPMPTTLPSSVRPLSHATAATAPRVPHADSCSTESASSGLGAATPVSHLDSIPLS
ncbi:MAG: hypothetical protein WA441_00015 [Methyloceanibacter sp.]